jgi:hypothetical protein
VNEHCVITSDRCAACQLEHTTVNVWLVEVESISAASAPTICSNAEHGTIQLVSIGLH